MNIPVGRSAIARKPCADGTILSVYHVSLGLFFINRVTYFEMIKIKSIDLDEWSELYYELI